MVKSDKIKTLVLPTLCGSAIWKQVADPNRFDKIVFNGGITTKSTAFISHEAIKRTVWEVLEFADKHPKKVDIIISKTDYLYLDDEIKYDQYLVDSKTKADVRDVLQVALGENVLKIATNIKNYIFVHGAISKDWYFNVFEKAYRLNCAANDDKSICEKLQTGFKNKTLRKEFYKSVYGAHVPTAPFNMYHADMGKDPLKGYVQVSGTSTDFFISYNSFTKMNPVVDNKTELIVHNTLALPYTTAENKFLKTKTFPVLTLNI